MIIEGDCLEVMKTFPDNHFSAIVTDPPYGLKFMGKDWDHGIPGVHFWEEALRISKPGTFLLAFGGTRTYHRLTCAIEDAGWEIRDCLMWIYGSGFPKGKGCLKPAYEPILLARKKAPNPLLNIDECRIGTDDTRSPSSKNALGLMNDDGWKCKSMIVGSENGRWPANIMFDEEAAEMLDEQSGVSRSSNKQRNNAPSPNTCMSGANTGHISFGHSDSGGASRFFYCAKTSSSERNEGLEGLPKIEKPLMGEFKENPGRTIPKCSPSPKENHHPTVKPLALMRYLIKLIAPPTNALILDPFAGSGSTIVAAKQLGIEAIGIEKQPEYCEIARKRLDHESSKPKQQDLFDIR